MAYCFTGLWLIVLLDYGLLLYWTMACCFTGLWLVALLDYGFPETESRQNILLWRFYVKRMLNLDHSFD